MKHASIFSYHNWWLIHPDSQTTAGVWLAQPPYLKVAITVDCATLGCNLLSALAQSRHNIPHPTVWDKNDPVLELAGAKSWRAFAKDATYFDVTCDDGCVTIARWDYRAKDAAFI